MVIKMDYDDAFYFEERYVEPRYFEYYKKDKDFIYFKSIGNGQYMFDEIKERYESSEKVS